jgi:hypothetical protein
MAGNRHAFNTVSTLRFLNVQFKPATNYTPPPHNFGRPSTPSNPDKDRESSLRMLGSLTLPWIFILRVTRSELKLTAHLNLVRG